MERITLNLNQPTHTPSRPPDIEVFYSSNWKIWVEERIATYEGVGNNAYYLTITSASQLREDAVDKAWNRYKQNALLTKAIEDALD